MHRLRTVSQPITIDPRQHASTCSIGHCMYTKHHFDLLHPCTALIRPVSDNLRALMPSPPLPRDVLNHIFDWVFLSSVSEKVFSSLLTLPDDMRNSPAIALTLVSSEFRLAVLPYFFRRLVIKSSEDWSLFFSPDTGIFNQVDGRVRWSWVREIWGECSTVPHIPSRLIVPWPPVLRRHSAPDWFVDPTLL